MFILVYVTISDRGGSIMSGPMVNAWCDIHGDYKKEKNGNPYCLFCYLKMMNRMSPEQEKQEQEREERERQLAEVQPIILLG